MIIPYNALALPLDQLRDAPAAAAYGLRRLKSGYKGAPIRVRDDTNTELDIPFCGQDLCTGTLLSWLGRNQVASIPLGTDGNADGASDGWGKFDATGITHTLSIENGIQKSVITNSTSANDAGIRLPQTGGTLNVCAVGNAITASAKYIGSTNGRGRININWYDAGSVYISTVGGTLVTGNDAEQTIAITATAPANAVKFIVYVLHRPVNIGDTPTSYFKDASVTISNQSAYVTTWYDQSGNGLNATQTTAANQPRIVNAGVVDVDSAGRPTIQTIQANDTHFVVANNTLIQFVSNVTFSIVHNPASLGENSAGRFLDKNSSLDYFVTLSAVKKITIFNAQQSSEDAIALGIVNINTVTKQSVNGGVNFYKNGVHAGVGNGVDWGVTTNNLYLLNRSALDLQYDGKISELILFGTTLSDAQRQKLERNQGKYFGIGVI